MARLDDLQKQVQDLEVDAELKEGLPHLFGMKLYKWAHEYIESTNRLNFLCAANQISKSSTNIRKAIKWATSPHIWPKLWPSKPNQFWYFYPSIRVCTEEFHEKWVKEWLPRGEFKNHPVFGWEVDIQQKKIVAIRFNSGISIYFRSYEQRVSNIQTASVHAMFGDEEMPVEIYDEAIMRLSSPTIQGHFHMVFTATLGLEFWREVIEEKGVKERFPHAWKRQVSAYDCLQYMDGSPSPWTKDKIEANKRRCKSDAEIQRRIYGRFVIDEGLKYESYRRARNFIPPYPIPKDWLHYCGVDLGSGGEKGHPSAICLLAVRPDFQKAAVYAGWRGDGEDTTAGDVFTKWKLLKGSRVFVGQYYDWQAKDFFNIAMRLGEPFQPAEKSHAIGEQVLNVLFKNEMLDIFDTPELQKLDGELQALKRETSKQKAKDDFCDALRYSVTKVPWDFSCLDAEAQAGLVALGVAPDISKMSKREVHYKGLDRPLMPENPDDYQGEFDEANALMDYDW